MIHLVCSVRDSKMEAYMIPFYVRTLGAAERLIQDELAKEDSLLRAHPADFVLMHVGSFDDETGVLAPSSDGPNVVCAVAALVPDVD